MEDDLRFFATELNRVWNIDNIMSDLTIETNCRMASFDSTFFYFQFTININYPLINNDNKIKFVTHLHDSFPFVFQKMTESIRNEPDVTHPVSKVKIFMYFTFSKLIYNPVLQTSQGNKALTKQTLSFADADLLMITYDQIVQQLSSVQSVIFTRSNKRVNYNDSRIHKFHSNVDGLVKFEINFIDVEEEDVIHQRVIDSFRESLLQLVEDLQIYSMKQVKSKYARNAFPSKAALNKVALQVINKDTNFLKTTIIIEDVNNEEFELKPTLLSAAINIRVPLASKLKLRAVKDDPFRAPYDGPEELLDFTRMNPVHLATVAYNDNFIQGPVVQLKTTNQIQEQAGMPMIQSVDAHVQSGNGKTKRESTETETRTKSSRTMQEDSLSTDQFRDTFEIIVNCGEGNCLFLAVQYFLPLETHISIRQKVADYYCNHVHEHINNINYSVGHGRKIRNQCEWGNAQDIYIVGEIFDITIKVYMINNKTNNYRGYILTQLPEKDKCINILYSNNNHYEALSIKNKKYLRLIQDMNAKHSPRQQLEDKELQLQEDKESAKDLQDFEIARNSQDFKQYGHGTRKINSRKGRGRGRERGRGTGRGRTNNKKIKKQATSKRKNR